MDIQGIDQDLLVGIDLPRMIFIKVRDANNLLWVDNPKLHDIGGTITSIQKYGFQEIPKFDKNLPNVSGGDGAIKAGNGRIECLWKMELDGDYELPRGIAKVKDSGEWVMPLIIGTDAESLEMAIAYGVDSNSLTLSGGDYDARDYINLWEPTKFYDLMTRLVAQDAAPVSFQQNIDEIMYLLEKRNNLEIDFDDFDNQGDVTVKYRIVINNFEGMDEAIEYLEKYDIQSSLNVQIEQYRE